MENKIALTFILSAFMIGGMLGYQAAAPKKLALASTEHCSLYCDQLNSTVQMEMKNDHQTVCYCDDRLNTVYVGDGLGVEG